MVHAAADAHRVLLEQRAGRESSSACRRSRPRAGDARRRSARVSVATPERCCRRFSTTRSPARMRPRAPGDATAGVPTSPRSPSAAATSTATSPESPDRRESQQGRVRATTQRLLRSQSSHARAPPGGHAAPATSRRRADVLGERQRRGARGTRGSSQCSAASAPPRRCASSSVAHVDGRRPRRRGRAAQLVRRATRAAAEHVVVHRREALERRRARRRARAARRRGPIDTPASDLRLVDRGEAARPRRRSAAGRRAPRCPRSSATAARARGGCSRARSRRRTPTTRPRR